MTTHWWEPHIKEILITEEQLKARIREMGQKISADFANKDLLMICILKGGVPFMTELMIQVSTLHEIDFMAVSSYGRGARESKGVVQILKDLNEPLAGKHVLVVEDIIDSGYMLNYILRMLQTRGPASIKLCTLLDKPSRREIDIPVDYVGFTIEDRFVVGFGLDIDEKFRNLPFIAVSNLE